MDAILAFHSVDDGGSVLSYRADDLAAMLDRLQQDGVAVVSLDEILQPAASGHRVALTFDDSLRSVTRAALPVLERAGVKATVYAVSGWIGADNQWPTQTAGIPAMPLMSWEELQEWVDAGGTVGAHTTSHVYLPGLDRERYAAELDACRSELEQRLQRPVEHFAYPYGAHDEESVRQVGRVFRTATTTVMSYLSGPREPLRLPRLDAYYLRGAWARRALFGAATRAYLGLRARLRLVRGSMTR